MIIVITGPTCTSKSKIAIEVAKYFNAEIINADAFQIYKELDIGTAKPSKEDLKKIKHHLYDIKKPTDNYSIAEYQKDCRKVIKELIKQKKNVVLVGGSGLYIRSALYDYDFSKPIKEVNLSKYEKLSNEDLHKELIKIDPLEAKRIHPNNRKRVLRAIAIYLSSNKTKTEIEANQKHKIIFKDVHIYAIDMPRDILIERINKRVDQMVDSGLINECKSLVKKYSKDLQSLNAIGYREIIQNPRLNDKEITELIKIDTRQYAKRQMTFIRYQYGNDFKWVTSSKDIINDLTSDDISSRTRALLGDSNLSKVNNLKVAIFGIGGVGGTAAEALARTGIKELYLYDFDKVNSSNLNRQILFTSKDLKKSKVKVAKERINKINKDVKVFAKEEFVTPENISKIDFNKFDFVIDAIDSTKSKLALIKHCLKHKIKFISSLGMGNRFDLTKLEITTLDKTHDDPLAKKLREELKRDKIDIRKIKVVTSNEVPIKNGNVITSMIFVPSTAGLLLASHIINEVRKKEK